MVPCCHTHAPACAHAPNNQAKAPAQRYMPIINIVKIVRLIIPLRQLCEESKMGKGPFLVMGNYKIHQYATTKGQPQEAALLQLGATTTKKWLRPMGRDGLHYVWGENYRIGSLLKIHTFMDILSFIAGLEI